MSLILREFLEAIIHKVKEKLMQKKLVKYDKIEANSDFKLGYMKLHKWIR